MTMVDHGLRRPAVDPSRIRRACLGKISEDPLVYCQGLPRPGKSACDDCLSRNNTTLEGVLRREAKRLLDLSWERISVAEHRIIAARLADVRRFLRLAGCPTIDIDREWAERYRRYIAAGGRAPFRELSGGYDW